MELFTKLYALNLAILASIMQTGGELEIVSGIAVAIDQLGVTGVLISIIVLLLKERDKVRKTNVQIIDKISDEYKDRIKEIENRHKEDVKYYRDELKHLTKD